MKLQFRSNLLAQIKQCLKTTDINEHLVLLGNNFMLYGSHVQTSKKLLDYCSYNWEKVYVVPGTIELLGDGLQPISRNSDILSEFIAKSPGKNIQFLNNSEVHDGNHMLVGSTFWCGSGVPPIHSIALGRAATIKQLDDWAKDDAYYIGSMIKQASCQSKHLTIATYFSHNDLSAAAKQQLMNGAGNTDAINGRWICGY
jgi:hypothetical protein